MSLWQYLWAGSTVTQWLYHLDGNSNDSSGNAVNGTDVGSPTYSQANGYFNQWVAYGNGIYTNVGNNFLYGRTTPFTYIARFKSTNTWWYNFFFSNEAVSVPLRGMVFYLDNTQQIRFDFLNTFNLTRYTLQSTETYTSWKWQLLQFSYNWSWPSTTNMTATLDWVPLTLTAITDTIGANDWSSAWPTWLGSRPYDSTQFFNGNLDEMVFENVNWSYQKMKNQYTYQKWRFGIL